MSGTGFGLFVGLVYGAVLGIYAYRWYERQRGALDARDAMLQDNLRSLAREVHALKGTPVEVGT